MVGEGCGYEGIYASKRRLDASSKLLIKSRERYSMISQVRQSRGTLSVAAAKETFFHRKSSSFDL